MLTTAFNINRRRLDSSSESFARRSFSVPAINSWRQPAQPALKLPPSATFTYTMSSRLVAMLVALMLLSAVQGQPEWRPACTLGTSLPPLMSLDVCKTTHVLLLSHQSLPLLCAHCPVVSRRQQTASCSTSWKPLNWQHPHQPLLHQGGSHKHRLLSRQQHSGHCCREQQHGSHHQHIQGHDTWRQQLGRRMMQATLVGETPGVAWQL